MIVTNGAASAPSIFTAEPIPRSDIGRQRKTVAIVGTGPSALYTLHGLIEAERPHNITLFESGDLAGVGTPYDPRTNSIEMLANIASVEIPPIGISFLAFLQSCDDLQLQQVGVDPAELSDRAFYPRVAVGAYFRNRLSWLTEQAKLRGHKVDVLTRHRVVDVVPTDKCSEVRYVPFRGHPVVKNFDKVVLATGHTAPGRQRRKVATTYDGDGAGEKAQRFGIIGSSLSAIDLAVAIACDRGAFVGGRYVLDDQSLPFTVTLMSRGGHLPEADFYCPLPAPPADQFSEDNVLALVAAAQPGAVLDVVFQRFAQILEVADPEYAERIGLANLTADTFPAAYFAERDAHDPLSWARQNLAEAQMNHRRRYVVPWRYTILRCHEAFGSCVDALNDEDLARFNAGMKTVFADNYAAVPPLSIARLLALNDAGVLTIERLARGYELSVDEESGAAAISSAEKELTFDRVFDARGQGTAEDEDFPFPTLRLALLANRNHDDSEESAIRVDQGFRLAEGLNPLEGIWCLSIPFLLERNPFIQGLTSAADMGAVTALAILADTEMRDDMVERSMAELLDIIEETAPVIMANGTVLLAPKAPVESAYPA